MGLRLNLKFLVSFRRRIVLRQFLASFFHYAVCGMIEVRGERITDIAILIVFEDGICKTLADGDTLFTEHKLVEVFCFGGVCGMAQHG
jgi:hypothetical protein